MVISEALMQVFSGTMPHVVCSDRHVSNSNISLFSKPRRRCIQKSGSVLLQQKGIVRISGPRSRFYRVPKHKLSKSQIYCCQSAESVNRRTTAEENETWYVDNAKKLNAIGNVVNGPTVLGFQGAEQLQGEKEGTISSRSVRPSRKVTVDPIEEEAWKLLQESVVTYCGSPVGTIAARDPTCSDALNYDQVFIRDFIPSGVAFLLKGEYDIVRNFILHTLQLQVRVVLPPPKKKGSIHENHVFWYPD